MKLFDVGQQANGFIAIGQQATGVIALGQMATGFIAIGQLARGVIAIGQAAVGLVGWGMGGVGVFHAVGMLGVGGRGFGGVVRLVPSLGRPRALPAATTLEVAAAGKGGWIEVRLDADLRLTHGGAAVPVKLDRRLQTGARDLLNTEGARALAHVRKIGDVMVCDRLTYAPARPFQKKSFWIVAAFQLIGLVALGTVWSAVVGHDLALALDKMTGDAHAHPRPAPRAPRVRGR